MITYILNSVLCLVLILFVYKLLLERERMYTFNRYYLLFGLCFACVVPTIEVTAEIPLAESATMVNFDNSNFDGSAFLAKEATEITTSIPTWLTILVSLYVIGCLVLFIRFMNNIYHIFYKITRNTKVFYKKASLVLLKENILPHTFLHYIFIKKEAYDTKNIAEELYTHELAHVTQKHTLDILFIELVQIVFWFNPILMYYKKAIQLNHEFLADDAVLKSHTQIPVYQQLLLDNASWNHNAYLVSNLNFSVTKKRLEMMTKHTSKIRTWLFAVLTIPVFIGAFFLFSTKVIAQKATITQKTTVQQTKTPEIRQKMSKAAYYKNIAIYIETANGASIVKKYNELTPEQQSTLPPVPTIPVAKRPTKQLLNNWKDSNTYAIWINEKHVPNTAIADKEFVYYTESFVHKNARSHKFPQPYQINLYTQEKFQSYQNSVSKELPKGAKLHIRAVQKDGKKATYEKSFPRKIIKTNSVNTLHDIIIRIDKKNTISVNEFVIKSIDNLSPRIKKLLSSMENKKSPITAAILYNDSTKSTKDLIAKVKLILERNNITEIRTILSNELEVPPPPPPPAPPAPKKVISVKEINPPKPPKPKRVEVVEIPNTSTKKHKNTKGSKLKTMMINGKKHFYIIKSGRKFIYNEDGKLVDKNGNELPPPPPPAKKKVGKSNTSKNGTAEWRDVAYFLDKEKKNGTVKINNETYYYAIQKGEHYIYNRFGQRVDKNGNIIKTTLKKKGKV